jgi:hypothetical protein
MVNLKRGPKSNCQGPTRSTWTWCQGSSSGSIPRMGRFYLLARITSADKFLNEGLHIWEGKVLANGTHKTMSSRMSKELMVPGNEARNKFLGHKNSPVLVIRLTIFNDIIITKLRDTIVISSLGHNAKEGRITLLSSMEVRNGNRTKFLHAVLNRIEEIRIVKTILGLLH